jgi:bacterioferritin
VEKPDTGIACLLQDDLASEVSELSAITQYLFHEYVLEPRYRDLAEALDCISRVEMHHYEILNQLIVMLGGVPRLQSCEKKPCVPWNASYVNYSTDPRAAVLADIEGERAAIRQYTAHIARIPDPNVKDNLSRIIQDEEHHIQILSSFVGSESLAGVARVRAKRAVRNAKTATTRPGTTRIRKPR